MFSRRKQTEEVKKRINERERKKERKKECLTKT